MQDRPYDRAVTELFLEVGASFAEPEDIKRRIHELSPWYHNIQLGEGIWTKSVDANAIYPEHDIPAPLWAEIVPRLGSLTGKRVLDIGCNAGFMSFECKKLGAEYVLGVDDDSGARTSFIAQAEFCREALGLDVDFRRGTFMELAPEPRFDVVLFCGVLYHLENWADGLDQLDRLVAPGDGLIVLETAIDRVTQTAYGDKAYWGDKMTYFVPSLAVLDLLLRERGFDVRELVHLGERGLAFLHAPSA